MTIVSIDNQKIKKRVKAIIEDDTTLFGKDAAKIRQVIVGTPPNQEYRDLHHPAIVITNSERWMEEENRGPVVNNQKTSVKAIARYDIILTVQMEDSNKAEAEIDRLWILFEQQLYKFATLRNPTGGLDPLCEDILLENTRRIPQFQGSEIDGFKSTLKVLINPNA